MAMASLTVSTMTMTSYISTTMVHSTLLFSATSSTSSTSFLSTDNPNIMLILLKGCQLKLADTSLELLLLAGPLPEAQMP